MPKKIEVSVIIPFFNAKKYLKKCLGSLLKNSCKNYEVILVNDSSTDTSNQIIKKYYPKNKKIKLITNKRNLGPAKSRNLAASISSGRYLLFLDVDTKIDKNCLKEIVCEFKKHPQTGAIQCQLLKAKNKLDAIGHFLSVIGFPYEIGVGENPQKYSKRKLIFGAKTAALAVKKTTFKKIGGFDDDYFIYGEDTDLCWRIWLANQKIYYLPSAKVFHFQKSSLNKNTKHLIFYEGAKNNINYLLKNSSPSLLFLIPINIFFWALLSVKQIFFGKFFFALNIYKGIFWNIIHLKRTLLKRKIIKKRLKNKLLTKRIIFGEEETLNIIKRGLNWFKNV